MALDTKGERRGLTWAIRDHSRIQIAVFPLEKASLKPCKRYSYF